MRIVNKLKFIRFVFICIGLMFVGGYIAYAQFSTKEVINHEPLDYALESVEITQEIDYISPIIPDAKEVVKEVVDPEDIKLLSKVLYSEINFAYHDGKWVKSTDKEMALVGAVVMNRIEHNSFPDSLEGVIYQETQFCSVRSDTWGMTTNRTDRIAKEVLQGKYDLHHDVLYFFNPDLSTNTSFVNSKMELVVLEAGGHVFTK